MKKLIFSLLLGASLVGFSSCDEKVKYTIDVNPKSPSLYEGSSLKITVKSDPEGLPLPKVGISFSPEGIASVDVVDDGYLLKGLKAGKTTMTLFYGELSHEVQITVKKKSSNNNAPSGDGGNEGEDNPGTDPIPSTPSKETTDHEYVDLGLSVMWATCNIGAENPWDYGLYFAWGDTTGYAKDEAHEFNWANCFDTTDGKTFAIYHNGEGGLKELKSDHDAATKNWGGKWRMPSKEESAELHDEEKIHSEWITNYKDSNVKGRVFYKKKEGEATYNVNSDVHIFLPAAGYRDNKLGNDGSFGYYWLRSLYENNSDRARSLYFYSSPVDTKFYFRYNGLSVRPVCPRAD